MKRLRRFSSAIVLSAMVSGGMVIGSARVEAKGRPQPDPNALCAYLYSVITYPNVNPYIQQVAINAYLTLGCDVSYQPLP
jgi:hypothetical protein